MKDAWMPGWAVCNRKPTFIGGPSYQTFEKKEKYLWGNMPAIDVLRLEDNEDTNYDQDFHLLFAGTSGAP